MHYDNNTGTCFLPAGSFNADLSESQYQKLMKRDAQFVNMATDRPDHHSKLTKLLEETNALIDGYITKGVELFELFIDLNEKYVTNTFASTKVSKVTAGKFQSLINLNEPLSKPTLHFLSSKKYSAIALGKFNNHKQ